MNHETEKKAILATEYCPYFDELRQNRMVVSYFKYGPIADNYKKQQNIDAVASLKKRIKMYEDTGNTEYLVDVANFAMIEFLYPQHTNAHFHALDDSKSHIVGMGVAEMARFADESQG